MNNAAIGGVSYTMNTSHGRTLLARNDRPTPHTRGAFDWAGQIKLAIVLSVVAALITASLAGRVAEPMLIVGVIVVASFAGWARIEPAPSPVGVRRR